MTLLTLVALTIFLAATPLLAAGRAPGAQQAYLKASNTDPRPWPGSADAFSRVAISGDTIVVGAPLEDSGASGVNGDQADNSLPESGAAYVFVRNGGVWSQQAYLKASSPGQFAGFGGAVAVSGDTVVVGASPEGGAGAAYVFVRNGGVWSQQARLTAPHPGVGDHFGWSVAVSGDTIVVGAPGEDSNATGIDGDGTNDSTENAGAAYVFVRNGGVWSQQAYLKSSLPEVGDALGASVAVSGDTVVAGANGEDSNATGVNGNQDDNSLSLAGAAYVFVRNAGVWSQQAYLKASNPGFQDQFGRSVAVSGDTIAVGAPWENSNATGINGNQADTSLLNAGAVYVFVRHAGVWSQQAYVKASNTQLGDVFGESVGLAGDRLVVGAPFEDSSATGVNGDQADNSAKSSGAAYSFHRAAGVWSQLDYLKASNTEAADLFGSWVAVDGETAVVSALFEDSNATGVDGDGSNNSALSSGAAYVFTLSGPANSPPIAACQGVTVPTDEGLCSAGASIDAGSSDPDGDPITTVQDPPGPYGLGDTLVTLTVTDDGGLSDSCQATVTVEDRAAPVIFCNAPATITPPDAPISFTATAEDNCSVASVEVTGYDCWMVNRAGKRVDKTGSCVVSFDGDTLTVEDSGGVGDHIEWTVTATDGSGNPITMSCSTDVVNPGKGKGR